MNRVDIQQKLKDLMAKYDLSREDVASKLGMSIMTIYRWEKGKNLPKSRLAVREFEKLEKNLEKTRAF